MKVMLKVRGERQMCDLKLQDIMVITENRWIYRNCGQLDIVK